MTPDDFIDNLKAEMENLLAMHKNEFDAASKTQIASLIDSMNLSDAQIAVIHKILRITVEDTLYNVLCGLEGHAAIGGVKQQYTLLDEAGVELSGELDRLLYERLLVEDHTE